MHRRNEALTVVVAPSLQGIREDDTVVKDAAVRAAIHNSQFTFHCQLIVMVTCMSTIVSQDSSLTKKTESPKFRMNSSSCCRARSTTLLACVMRHMCANDHRMNKPRRSKTDSVARQQIRCRCRRRIATGFPATAQIRYSSYSTRLIGQKKMI